MLKIKFLFGDWKEATEEQAEALYKSFCNGSQAIKSGDKQQYFNDNHIIGGHIMATGKVKTA